MAKKKSKKKDDKKKESKKKLLKLKPGKKKAAKKKDDKKKDDKKKADKKKADKKKADKKKAEKKKVEKKKAAKKKAKKKKPVVAPVIEKEEQVVVEVVPADHSSNYNVREALKKMRQLTSVEEVLAFTEGESRLTLSKAIPPVIRRLEAS